MAVVQLTSSDEKRGTRLIH